MTTPLAALFGGLAPTRPRPVPGEPLEPPPAPVDEAPEDPTDDDTPGGDE